MGTNLRSWLCFILLFFVVVGVNAQNRRPKNVQVAVRAKWQGTPLLLEAGELISKESKQLFWEFTDAWLGSDGDTGDSDCKSARDCLLKISKQASSLLAQPVASLFHFSLTLRSASPRLVLYRQLADESLSSFPRRLTAVGLIRDPLSFMTLQISNPGSPLLLLLETRFRGLSFSTLITFILIQELEAQLLFSMGLLGLIALGNFTSRLLKQPRREKLHMLLDQYYLQVVKAKLDPAVPLGQGRMLA